MIGRNSRRACLLVATTLLMLAMATSGQERTENVLTLDQAIELARANNRETKRAKFEIDKQSEASAEARTSYFPRFDTYLLATELEKRARGNAYGASAGRGHHAAQNAGLDESN